ncbi:MAG: GAF domain-containing protein [Coraliomargarita sp.]
MFPKTLVEDCHQLLDEGSAELGMPIGIVSHIFNGDYQIVAINCGNVMMMDGSVFPLQETYCRDVYKGGKTLAITEIGGVRGMRLHPLYIKLPLEAYISSPVRHRNLVWGTVNFTSPKTREPFTEYEIKLVEGLAKRVSEQLDRLDGPTGYREASRSRSTV